MEPLPWLVVHGDVVWRAALGAFLLVGTVLGYVLSRRKLRRRVSAASASLGRPVQDLTTATIGSTVCVTGVLQASPPLCRSWAGTNRVAASTAVWLPTATHGAATLEEGAARFEGARARAGSLELVVPGGVIRLCGPVHVVLGSAEQSKGGLRAPLDNALSEALQLAVGRAWDPGAAPRIVHVRDLLPHDRVLVSGEVYEEASAGDAPTDYRHAGARRVLGAQDRGVKVVAVRTPARAQERGAVRGLLAGAAGFVLLFGVGGEVASGMALTNVYDFRSQHHVWTAELAAATPARRAHILERIQHALDGGMRYYRAPPLDGSGLERHLAIRELRGLGRCDGLELRTAEAVACRGGERQSCWALGNHYLLGKGIPRDLTCAYYHLAHACQAGSGRACGGLAYMFDSGIGYPSDQGVERDSGKAAVLLEQGCNAGHLPCCTRLGELTWSGRGVERHGEKARQLYLRACEGRAGGGCLRLADTAGTGIGLGTEPGDDGPFAVLHRMVELDKEAERWRKQGSEWLRAECEEGQAESCGELAAYLLDRRSPAPDERETTKAKQLLERACELGHAPSCERESGSSP